MTSRATHCMTAAAAAVVLIFLVLPLGGPLDSQHVVLADVVKKTEAIERFDAEGLLSYCQEQHVSMCGRAPAAVVLEATLTLGATSAEVVDYRHSGEVTGDDRDVVAYAGVVIR